MKSPKNIVKAFMLTSLIVSSISAIEAEDFPRVTSAAPAIVETAVEAAPVAAGKLAAVKGFFSAGCDYARDTVAAYPKPAKGLAATGALATLGGLVYYGYQNSWASRAWNKTQAACSWVKDKVVNNPWKTALATTGLAATGAAAYFCPAEKRDAVLGACAKGLNYVKDAAKAHPYRSVGAVATVPAAYGAYKGYKHFTSPAAEASEEGQPTTVDTTVDTTPAQAVDKTPAQAGETTPAQEVKSVPTTLPELRAAQRAAGMPRK